MNEVNSNELLNQLYDVSQEGSSMDSSSIFTEDEENNSDEGVSSKNNLHEKSEQENLDDFVEIELEDDNPEGFDDTDKKLKKPVYR